MPKILITEPCVVTFGDDRGGVHADAGTVVNVPKDVAKTVISIGRALYVNKEDDPDKRGRDTASSELLQAAGEAQKSGKQK